MRRSFDLEIPDADAAVFHSLPLSAKQEYLNWKHEFKTLAGTHGRLGDLLKAAGQRQGASYSTARRKWDAAMRIGWRGLIDQRRAMKAAESTVPPAFWEWWRALCEKEGRSCAQAHRRIITMWECGELLPGYDVNPPADISGHPAGLGLRNCMRHAPTRYELKAMRIGGYAAKSDTDLVLTTRVGLPIGKVLMIDDQWHDDTVIFEGTNRQTVRPLEMCCNDVASACKIAYGLRPRFKRDDGSHEQLGERDTRLLVVSMLLNQGYRADGTLLTVEGGTATIRRKKNGEMGDFEKALDAFTGGAVRVLRGKSGVAPVVLGGWPGPAKGNFRLKASLESLHGLDHNALGLIPGQTGSNSRENRPEKLTAIETYTKNLLQQVDALPKARATEIMQQLQFELMQWQDYSAAVADVYRWIAMRYNHDLEGWTENGWTTQEFRDTPEDARWLPANMLAKLTPERRELVLARISHPGCKRIRRLSPLEVWKSGSKELVRLQPEHVPMLLGPDMAEVRGLDRHGCIKFDAQEYGGGNPLIYPSRRLVNVLGQEIVIDPRKSYKVFPNPFDTTRLFVCDMEMRYLGYARRQMGVSRSDLDAIHKAIGKSAHGRAVLDAPLQARHSADADDRAAMLSHNTEVMADAGAIETDAAPFEDAASEEDVDAALAMLDQGK
jgi:hypothetical protein